VSDAPFCNDISIVKQIENLKEQSIVVYLDQKSELTCDEVYSIVSHFQDTKYYIISSPAVYRAFIPLLAASNEVRIRSILMVEIHFPLKNSEIQLSHTTEIALVSCEETPRILSYLISTMLEIDPLLPVIDIKPHNHTEITTCDHTYLSNVHIDNCIAVRHNDALFAVGITSNGIICILREELFTDVSMMREVLTHAVTAFSRNENKECTYMNAIVSRYDSILCSILKEFKVSSSCATSQDMSSQDSPSCQYEYDIVEVTPLPLCDYWTTYTHNNNSNRICDSDYHPSSTFLLLGQSNMSGRGKKEDLLQSNLNSLYVSQPLYDECQHSVKVGENMTDPSIINQVACQNWFDSASGMMSSKYASRTLFYDPINAWTHMYVHD
jgi:hypothetical protein